MKNKLLQIKNKLSDNKKRAVAWLLVGSLILGLAPIPTTTVSAVENGEHFTETNTGDMNRVPYNNEGLTVDLSSAIFGSIAVGDHNGDGVLDIVFGSTCEGMPDTQVFYGKANSQNPEADDYMVMEKSVKQGAYGEIHSSAIYNDMTDYASSYQGTIITTSVYTRGTVSSLPYAGGVNYQLPYLDKNSTTEEIQKFSDQLIYQDGTQVTLIQQGVNPEAYSYSFADYDGDGDLDLIYSISSWEDMGWSYGTPAAYDDNGVWDTDGDEIEDRVYGWVFWFENQTTYPEGTTLWDTKGTTSTPPKYGEPKVIMVYDDEDKANPLTTYSYPEAEMFDFDNDGDLDMVCGSFLNEIMYYENVQKDQSLEMPKFKEGRPFVDEAGQDIYAEYMNLTLAVADWNKDGNMDVLVSEEDTRVFLLENTGEQQNGTNTPIMKAPQYFQQEADSIKGSSLSTPYSIDWDGDGDEDLLMGGGAGFISYYENLSIVEENGEFVQKRDLSDPSWARPVRFTDTTGEVYRINGCMEGIGGQYVGDYGSIQGTTERYFGYTKISVGYWDEDDILDVMSNNVRGEVYLHRGTQKGSTVLAEAELIKVEWEDDDGDGTPDPKIPVWYDRPYDQRKYYAEQGYLITQWRTTPFMIDLPLDGDGDGVALGDGLTDLVMLDHEGYLVFFERYEENGELKLKEGKRIFQDQSGNELGLRVFDGTYTEASQFDGKSGRRCFTMVDYDLDGDLDLIVDDQVNRLNVEYRENISEIPGVYKFAKPYSLHTRNYAYHTPSPTVCDWNQDGAPDILVGAESGYIYYLKNTVVKTPEDALVAHWDFEGNTEEVALADKGTAGNAENNLTIGGDTGNVSIENGIATIKSNGYLTTPNEADLNQTGEMTLFARVFVAGDKADITGSQTAETSFIDKRNGSVYAYSMGVYGQGTTDYAFTSYVDGMELLGNKNIRMAKGEWREIAAVVTEGEEGSWNYTLYMSKDDATANGTDFEQIYTTTFTNHRATSAALIIGNTFQKIDSSMTRKIDDVRIYDMALTTDQMATLLGELPISESLVAHWDFEGDATEALKDKAAAGAVADDLTKENDADGTNVAIENGIATFKSNGLLRAEGNSADLNQKGEMTILMRAYVDGNYTSNKEFAWLDKRSGSVYQYWIGGYQETSTSTSYKLQSAVDTMAISSGNSIAQGEWRELAVVVKQVEGVWTYEWYMSAGAETETGDNFVLLSTVNTGTTEPSITTNDLILGCRTAGNSTQTINTSDLTRKLDDVRIYNTALTTSEMAGLLGELPLSENLVAHWDFEGDETVALTDKATAGKTKDNLTKENETNVTISDGIATFTGNGALNAGTQKDLQQTGEMTIFLRAYVEGNYETEANKSFAWIDKRSGSVYQYYVGGFPESSSAASVRLGGYVDTNALPSGNYLAKGVWREIAIVAKQDGETWTYEWYVSSGARTTSENDYTLIHQVTGGSAPSINDENLILGCLTTAKSGATLTTSDLTRKLDDVRIYNTALSTGEMAGLINVEEVEWNLDAGVYSLEGTDIWVNGEKATTTTLTTSGDYEIAIGTAGNVVKKLTLYRPGNANLALVEDADVIDIRDLTAIVKASNGISLTSKAATKGADADSDVDVDADDRAGIRQRLLQ